MPSNMKPSPAPLNDDPAIERLLRDFFAQEMPPELQTIPDAPESSSRHPRNIMLPRRHANRRATLVGGASVTLAACAILAAVLANLPRPVPEAARPTRGDASQAASPIAEQSPEADESPLILVDRPDSRSRVPRQPVEQSNGLHWTDTRTWGNDAQIDSASPGEITVEVLPLDDEAARPQTTPQAPPDRRLPEARGR
jgi:hypothetical protein